MFSLPTPSFNVWVLHINFTYNTASHGQQLCVCVCFLVSGGGDVSFVSTRKIHSFCLSSLLQSHSPHSISRFFLNFSLPPHLTHFRFLPSCEAVVCSEERRDREIDTHPYIHEGGMREGDGCSAIENNKEEGEVMDTPERSKNHQIATSISKFEV